MGSLLLLFILSFVAIQIPSVQNYAKEKAVAYLEGKIKTKVRIDSLTIAFPKKVILKGVYFEDQKKDTLFAGEKLAADISLFELLSNKVEINSLELVGVSANLNRDSKAIFNFEFTFKGDAFHLFAHSAIFNFRKVLGNINAESLQFLFEERHVLFGGKVIEGRNSFPNKLFITASHFQNLSDRRAFVPVIIFGRFNFEDVFAGYYIGRGRRSFIPHLA